MTDRTPPRASDAAKGRRALVMIQRARTPLWIAMAMVSGVVICVPVILGLPSLSMIGVVICAALAVSLWAIDASPRTFRLLAHFVYLIAFVAVSYAIYGLKLAPVISVYFPAIVLLAAAQLLGARAALFWGIPSLVLVGAASFFPPTGEREVSETITFAVRASTLLTILTFAVWFRTSQDRQSAELELRAATDSLTGLANRRELARKLAGALLRAERFERQGAVVFVDLDGLKRVNDAHGHSAGDALIIGSAERIAGVTRSVDTPARLGGDEFVVLLSEFDDPKGGEIFGRKLLAVLGEPLEVNDQMLDPSASIGVALFPAVTLNSDDLLGAADNAMYQAKRAGGGRVFLHDESGVREVTSTS
jgi:diguanylate cyclase (GGDEF)-like protein